MLNCPICRQPVDPVDTARWCSGLAKTFTPNIGHPEMQVQILRARVAELESMNDMLNERNFGGVSV